MCLFVGVLGNLNPLYGTVGAQGYSKVFRDKNISQGGQWASLRVPLETVKGSERLPFVLILAEGRM